VIVSEHHMESQWQENEGQGKMHMVEVTSNQDGRLKKEKPLDITQNEMMVEGVIGGIVKI